MWFSSLEIKARFVQLGDITAPWHASAELVNHWGYF